MTSQKIILAVISLFLGLMVAYTNARVHTLNLHTNMQVTYELKVRPQDNKTICEFGILANTTGWVAIGFSENGTMYKSDIFMGFVNGTNSTNGGDYHVQANAAQRQPVLDAKQDWTVTGGWERDGKTSLTVVRLLDTGDAANDTVIENKIMPFIWSYNTNDDVTQRHSQRGNTTVNLVANADTGVPTPAPPPSQTTLPPGQTTSPPGQTTSPPGQSTTPNGASTLAVGVAFLAFGVLANVLQIC